MLLLPGQERPNFICRCRLQSCLPRIAVSYRGKLKCRCSKALRARQNRIRQSHTYPAKIRLLMLTCKICLSTRTTPGSSGRQRRGSGKARNAARESIITSNCRPTEPTTPTPLWCRSTPRLAPKKCLKAASASSPLTPTRRPYTRISLSTPSTP